MQANANRNFSKLPWTPEFQSEFPTHHARSFLENKDFESLQNLLYIEKHVDFRKSHLIAQVLKNEMGIVKNDNEIILTINLPFSEYKCVVCKRCLFRLDKLGDNYKLYMQALFKEVEQLREIIRKKCYIVKSICFIGDIFALEEGDITKLMQLCDYPLSEKNVEIENPNVITKEKLKLLKEFNVERIIFNSLTFNTVSLRKLCRHFNYKDVCDAVRLVSEFGFLISFAFVVGLSEEFEIQIKRNINQAIELGASSIELYSRFCPYENEIQSLSTQAEICLQRGLLETAYDTLTNAKFKPYFLYCTEVEGGCFENVGYYIDRKSKYIEDKRLRISTELACGCDVRSLVVKHAAQSKTEIIAPSSVENYITKLNDYLQQKENILLGN